MLERRKWFNEFVEKTNNMREDRRINTCLYLCRSYSFFLLFVLHTDPSIQYEKFLCKTRIYCTVGQLLFYNNWSWSIYHCCMYRSLSTLNYCATCLCYLCCSMYSNSRFSNTIIQNIDINHVNLKDWICTKYIFQ